MIDDGDYFYAIWGVDASNNYSLFSTADAFYTKSGQIHYEEPEEPEEPTGEEWIMSQRDNASFRPPEPLGRSPGSYLTRAYCQMYLDENTGVVRYEGVVDGLPVNVKDYGATGNGTTDDLAAINNAITALSGSGDVRFPKGTYLISDDLTVAAGIRLVFETGAKIKIADTKTLTINGNILSGLNQIFEYGGTGAAVVFSEGTVEEVYLEWWGGKSDNASYNNSAFNAALSALSTSGGTIKLQTGTYLLQNSKVNIGIANISIFGQGPNTTTLKQTTNGESCIWINTGATNISLKGIRFDGVGSFGAWPGRTAVDINQAGDYPGGSGNPTPKKIEIQNCFFVKPDMGGFSTDSCEDVTIKDCFFEEVGEHAIYISGIPAYTKRIKILNNTLKNTTAESAYLINLKNADGVLVKGNYLYSDNGIGNSMINIDPVDRPSNVIISENNIYASAMTALFNLGGDNVIVENNILDGGTNSAIIFRNGTKKTVRGNIISNSPGCALSSWADTSTDVSIINNNIYDCDSGINGTNFKERTRIAGNRIYSSTPKITGFYQIDSTVILEGNVIEGYSSPYQATPVGSFGEGDAVRAYPSANQLNLPDDVWTQIILDAESYDPNGNFAANAYTVPKTGYYRVNVAVIFTSVIANHYYQIAIRVDNTPYTDKRVFATTSNDLPIERSDIVYAISGKKITLWAKQNGEANTVDISGGSTHTFITVELVSMR